MTTPCCERRTFEGLISQGIAFFQCKYARHYRSCNDRQSDFKKNEDSRLSTTHPLSQHPRDSDLLSRATLPPLNLLPNSSEALSLAQLHHQLDLAIRRRHVRAVEPNDVRVSEAGDERELAHELLQRALMRDDRLAREPPSCPLVLHCLHRAARADNVRRAKSAITKQQAMSMAICTSRTAL